MKIYFIGQKGIPAINGGVERYVDDLSVHLAKQGHEVFVYVRKNYANKRLKKYAGVNLLPLSSINTKHLDTISYTFLAILDVLKRKADIVHFQSIGPSSLLWILKIFKRNTSIISTFHSQCYYHQKWGFVARWCLRTGEFILCTLSDAILVPSSVLQHYTARRYGREPIHISNSVNIYDLLPARRIKKWGLKKDNYIVAVSRLVKHKGLQYLIESYQKLDTDKKLVIVGDGAFTDDYVKELHQLAGNNKNIIFTGQVYGPILTELYSNACLFVQPSESEGLSIALLEAMSYGLPVLVSDIAENTEAVDKAGFIFKNKNVIDLTNKLKYILNNPKTSKYKGQRALERVSQYYNWEIVVYKVLDVYKEVVFNKQRKYFTKQLMQNTYLK